MPKLLTAAEAIVTGRTREFGGTFNAMLSVLADFVLLSIMAPVLMAYQTRSVFQVLMGRDGGWPPNRRGGAMLTVTEAWEACRFMVFAGVIGLVVAHFLTVHIILWMLPVLLPMIFSPLIISWTSRLVAPSSHRARLFTTPEEINTPPILALHDEILARWEQIAQTPDARAEAPGLMEPARV